MQCPVLGILTRVEIGVTRMQLAEQIVHHARQGAFVTIAIDSSPRVCHALWPVETAERAVVKTLRHHG